MTAGIVNGPSGGPCGCAALINLADSCYNGGDGMGKRNRKKRRPASGPNHKAGFSNRALSDLKSFKVDGADDPGSESNVPVAPPQEPNPDPVELDDDTLLAQALGDVTPLNDKAGRVVPKPRPKPMLAEADDTYLVMRHLDELVHGEIPFDFSDTDEYIEAAVSDLDRRVVRKLRRGEYAMQDHLDLHGLNRDEARRAVGEFIRKSHLADKRCVLIVHGRGMGSRDNIPVLKNKLRAWLTRGSIGRRVLAYTSARSYDGGAGAVYVLLRGGAPTKTGKTIG